MPSTEILNIDLRELALRGQAEVKSLDDNFFKSLEQEEIIGGDIRVQISVRESAGEVFAASVKIEGQVRVLCDRCLDELVIPVEVEDVIKILAGDAGYHAEDNDYRVIEGNGYRYDFSWDIYEMTELSLPLQRVHELNQCNPEMTDRLAKLI